MLMKSACQRGACTSAGRFTDYQLICQQKWEGISAAQFADWQLICQQIWRQKICWQEGFYYRQIYWLSVNLPADFGGECEDISWQKWGDRYFCQQIYWLSINLPADFGETGNLPAKIRDFCRLIYWLSVILPADLKTVRKSAGRNGGIFLLADLLSASRLTHYQLFCQQIWRIQSGNLLAEKVRWVYLPAHLLTLS